MRKLGEKVPCVRELPPPPPPPPGDSEKKWDVNHVPFAHDTPYYYDSHMRGTSMKKSGSKKEAGGPGDSRNHS